MSGGATCGWIFDEEAIGLGGLVEVRVGGVNVKAGRGWIVPSDEAVDGRRKVSSHLYSGGGCCHGRDGATTVHGPPVSSDGRVGHVGGTVVPSHAGPPSADGRWGQRLDPKR